MWGLLRLAPKVGESRGLIHIDVRACRLGLYCNCGSPVLVQRALLYMCVLIVPLCANVPTADSTL